MTVEVFWRWALARYAHEPARQHLLALQAELDLVIIEALFVCWLATEERRLQQDDVDALETLITQQRFADTRGLPEYDRALLRRELDLFPHWYLGEHRGLRLDGDTSGRLDAVFETLIESALAQPRVFVHRDFMPRNLMVSDPNPGVIDFQDAVAGPISYDLISLFKDAFLSWPEASVLEWLRDYHRRAAAAGRTAARRVAGQLPLPALAVGALGAVDGRRRAGWARRRVRGAAAEHAGLGVVTAVGGVHGVLIARR